MGRWVLIRHYLKQLKHESKFTLVPVILLLPSPMGDVLPLWFAGGRASVATSLLLLAACRGTGGRLPPERGVVHTYLC